MPFDSNALNLAAHSTLDAFLKAETVEDILATRDQLVTCDLLSMSVKPTLETLEHLPIQSYQAYIRVGEELYYVNKLAKRIACINVNAAQRDAFDAEFKPTASTQTLPSSAFKKITSFTGSIPSLPNYPYNVVNPTLKPHISTYEICAALGKIQHLLALFEVALPTDFVFYDLLCYAALHGQLVIIEAVKEHAQFLRCCAKSDNQLLRFAAMHGQLAMVNCLLQFEQIRVMLNNCPFMTLELAFTGGHGAVVRRLLDFPGSLAYAESCPSKYAYIVHQVVENKLQLLATNKSAYETSHPGKVYDINPDEVSYYFYLLRNLIRRNDRALDESIRQLLLLPSLQPILAARPPMNNELLRLAAKLGNQFAFNALFANTSVRELALADNYYPEEGNFVALYAWAYPWPNDREAKHSYDTILASRDTASAITLSTEGAISSARDSTPLPILTLPVGSAVSRPVSVHAEGAKPAAARGDDARVTGYKRHRIFTRAPSHLSDETHDKKEKGAAGTGARGVDADVDAQAKDAAFPQKRSRL